MIDDPAQLHRVITAITEFVRDNGRNGEDTLGTRIGAFLHGQFPDFGLREHGFTSLTDMLERAAPELSIIGRSGQDYLWSTDADLEQLDPNFDAPTGPGEIQSALLTRFSARSFKCLATLELELRPFNILVGANGAGKTSLLEGLFLLSQLRYKKPATIFSGVRDLRRLMTIGGTGPLMLRLAVGESGQYIEYAGEARDDGPDIHILRIHDGNTLHEHDYTRTRVVDVLPRKLSLIRSFGGTTLLRLDARRLARPVVSNDEYPTMRHDGLGLPAVLANLAATDRERLDAIFAATGAIIPGFESARMPRQRVVTRDGDVIGQGLELRMHGKWIDASLASEGTLLILGLMTIVHGLRSTRLLLMDDVDRALHPKAQRELMRRLIEMTKGPDSAQIVCTTHSPYLLDAAEADDVVVIRAMPDSGLSAARRLTQHDAWTKWQQSMTPGEFWSYVGEDWLEVE